MSSWRLASTVIVLFFCGHLPNAKRHFARIALANVALDPWVYNGHTTTIDMLRPGVPVVTMPGGSLASRVAAGIEVAAGMGVETITASAKEYEDRSLQLAVEEESRKLVNIRLDQRFSSPLFDLSLSTKAMEQIIEDMWAKSDT
eukprot:Rmarinus@m.11773